jgi:hypothetical protein
MAHAEATDMTLLPIHIIAGSIAIIAVGADVLLARTRVVHEMVSPSRRFIQAGADSSLRIAVAMILGVA